MTSLQLLAWSLVHYYLNNMKCSGQGTAKLSITRLFKCFINYMSSIQHTDISSKVSKLVMWADRVGFMYLKLDNG